MKFPVLGAALLVAGQVASTPAPPGWIDAMASELLPAAIVVRRDLHQHPELGFHETRTAGIVADKLRALKFDEVRTGVGVTGVVGVLKGGRPGPVVAIRADIDALPIPELIDVPYKSLVDNVKHACGHDGHTAIALGVAEMFSRRRVDLPGTVVFLFQPAEEGDPAGGLTGAARVLQDWPLTNPTPVAIFGLHLVPAMHVGLIGVNSGPAMSSSARFTATIIGKKTHGAMPHTGIDPIPIASEVVMALQTIPSRQIGAQEPTIVTVGSIAGGNRYNVIADSVRLEGTVRSFAKDGQATVKAKMEAILKGVTSSYGATYTLDYKDNSPVTYNDPKLAAAATAALTAAFGKDRVETPAPQMVSEDFAYYQQRIPGFYFFIGVGNPAKGITAMWHTEYYDMDEDALAIAMRAMATVVWDRLNAAAQTQTADLVLNHGTVITVDARDSVAEAIAIAGGKIVAVGTNAQIQKFIGEKTQVVDLHGRTATPGLIDTHVHFSEAADVLDLGDPSIKNMADVIAKVKAWADKLPPGQGVRGVGWDEGKLAERRYITAADLDKAAPDRPVYLTHTTGHYGVANSMAMRLANITKDTKDPPAGTIDRDKDGNPTGVFKEAATGMVSRVVGNSGPRESQEAQVLRIIAGFNREGMTGAKDLNIGQAKWDLYKRLLDEGKLTVRVAALWQGGRTVNSVQNALQQMAALPKAPQSVGDGHLVLEGLKLYIDGSGGARTAWMYEDWNKDWIGTDTGNPGYPTTPVDIYRQQVRLITEAGWSVGTHAIGDRGIDVVVDAYKDALEATGKKGLRHSIIHGNTPSDHAIETMAYLQKTFDAGYPEEQAPFMWWIGDTYAGNLGPKRAGRLEPLATFLKKGVIWAGGSDYSVTPYAGRYGLWASVARKTLNATYGATPFGTAESVNIHVALKSYTIWAAHQLFLEDRIGSLEAGKEADIAVWDNDSYKVPTDAIKDLKCEMTLVGGKIVFQNR